MSGDDTRRLLGVLLGEVYRVQKRVDPSMCGVGDDTIYGLRNGFEDAIDYVLESAGDVPAAQLSAMGTLLDEHFMDPVKLAAFKGFYDIEHDLQRLGIDRGQAIKILTYFHAGRRFGELIEKMNSDRSPSECRKFDLHAFDK